MELPRRSKRYGARATSANTRHKLNSKLDLSRWWESAASHQENKSGSYESLACLATVSLTVLSLSLELRTTGIPFLCTQYLLLTAHDEASRSRKFTEYQPFQNSVGAYHFRWLVLTSIVPVKTFGPLGCVRHHENTLDLAIITLSDQLSLACIALVASFPPQFVNKLQMIEHWKPEATFTALLQSSFPCVHIFPHL
ncbi:hypothetical protein Tco_1344741 [Tanacetum coccineum]